MSTTRTEIFVREQTKLVLKHLQHEEIDEARNIILKHKEILRYNFGLVNFVPLIPRIRFSKIIPKNNDALKMVIDAGFQIFSKEGDVGELLFFAAAKCDTDTLNYCVQKILETDPGGINQVREGDTALMFHIKFGNIADEKYPECMEILINAGIDVNRSDYFSHNPIVFIGKLYDRYLKRTQKHEVIVKNLRRCIELLLETKAIDLKAVGVYDTELTAKDLLQDLEFIGVNYSVNENVEEQKKDKLFKFLINCDEESFIKSRDVLSLLDVDDGNNTFLQLCCEKNLKTAAQFLVDKGADLTKTTVRNKKTPLEISARRNNNEIFEAILKTNKVVVDEELFKTFLRGRPKHIKAKYFDEILKYKNLDLNSRSNNGNTPLHYAIIFSSPEAVRVLLQRGASLTVENDSKKSPLDYITYEDLENHFNRCIVPDSYNDVVSGRCELALNYHSLLKTEGTCVQSELTIIEKICDSQKLRPLLGHPLISSFIDIKWKLVAPLYQKLLLFHALFYFVSILSFINLNLLSYLGVILAITYGLKTYYLPFSWKENKFHLLVEVTIASIILISSGLISNNFVRYQLGIIATIFMALSLHLLFRFSPKFAQFHAVLMNILGHIFSYLSYVFVLTLFFGAAYYIFCLVRYENDFTFNDKNFNNFFNTFRMVLSQFYLLCAFGVFMSAIMVITIINSFTNLQEYSEKIQNNFHLFGHKNILIFLRSVEEFYFVGKSIIKNPFIFDETYLKDINSEVENDKKKLKKNKNKNKFLVNFYINTNKFSFEKLLAVKLDDINIKKIKNIINR